MMEKLDTTVVVENDEDENIGDLFGINREKRDIEKKQKQIDDFEKIKKDFIDNLDTLKAMSLTEITLYKNYKMLKRMDPPSDQFETNFINKIWKPDDIFNKDRTIKEIEDLQPIVECVESRELAYKGDHKYKNLYPHTSFETKDWNDFITYVYSYENPGGPGRLLNFIVKNLRDDRILGIIRLASDVVAMKGRDDFIGWNQQHKMHAFIRKIEDKEIKGKLRHLAIGQTIVPTQPFGYNFLGGKLIACLTISKTPRMIWEEKFGDVLTGVSTTSLYGSSKGSMSQYTGIPYWNSVGVTSGKMSINPDKEFLKPMVEWFRKTDPELYDTLINDSNPKQKVLKAIYKKLGIKMTKYDNESPRGCYFSPIYFNSCEFLRDEIKEDVLKPKPFADDNSYYDYTDPGVEEHDGYGNLKNKKIPSNDYMVNWWKRKAISRYTKLHEGNMIKDEILYYGNIIKENMDWDEVRKKYLTDLGR